jgi:hypothetical protein
MTRGGTRWARWLAMIAAALGSIATPRSAGAQCLGCGDSVMRMHVHAGLGLRFGTPQRASLGLGVVTGPEWRSSAHPSTPDLLLVVEPGWSAGRLSVGAMTGFGHMGTGWGVMTTVLRTWRDSWGLQDNRTYVGAEVIAWPVWFIGPRLGIFHPINGDRRRGWFLTGDFGFGL